MRNLVIAAAMLAGTMAYADGPGNPYERPPLIKPATLSWGGLYAGVGITTKKRRTTTVTEVPEGFKKECTAGEGHSGQKCQITEYDWKNAPEVQSLDHVQSPWNKNGYRFDGVEGDIVRYTSGYYGIWLNDNESFSFTSDNDDMPGGSRGGSMTVSQVLTEVFTLGEDEELTGNAFAGYRHVFENGLAGGIEFGVVGGVEAQAGIGQGRVFAYTGFNSDQEVTVGADVLIGNNGLFAGAKLANGESTRGEFRVGWSF